MKNKSIIRGMGLLAILSTIGYILTINQTNRIIYGWSGLTATVLVGPAFIGVYLYVKNDQNEKLAKWAIIFLMAGLPLVAGIYVIAFLEAVLEAGIYDGAVDTMIMVVMDGGSFLTFGISGILFSLAIRRGTSLPRWFFQWLGIAAGILGLFWFGFLWLPGFLPGQIGFMIPRVGAALSLIWQFGLGVFMVAKPLKQIRVSSARL